MSPAPDFQLKAGDNASSIYGTCEDANGTAVSIQGATVKFKMASIAGGSPIVNAAAVNAQNGAGTVDQTVGHVRYDWLPGTAGDSHIPGVYLAEWAVTYVNGTVQTFPNGGYVLVEITPSLA